MIDFTRRSFLKGLGLGTVAALTLPKDMGVIAATLKDLEDLPIMAAYARFTPPPGFLIYSMHFTNCGNNWVTFQVRIVQPETLLLQTDVSKATTFDYPLMSPFLPQQLPVEIWAAREDGKPLVNEMAITLLGALVDEKGQYTLHRRALGSMLKHVRLDRDKAIKMGLVSIHEPEEVTEDTGKLIYEE